MVSKGIAMILETFHNLAPLLSSLSPLSCPSPSFPNDQAHPHFMPLLWRYAWAGAYFFLDPSVTPNPLLEESFCLLKGRWSILCTHWAKGSVGRKMALSPFLGQSGVREVASNIIFLKEGICCLSRNKSFRASGWQTLEPSLLFVCLDEEE